MNQKRIAIVGAGPAGLTAALAARQLGLEVRLFEQAPDFQRVGGGLMMHSNGQRVLDALGLLGSFEPHMRLTPVVRLEAASGRTLAASDFRQVTIPYNRVAVVLRYELQEHLLAAAVQRGVRVDFAHRLTAATAEDGRAVLHFDGGTPHEWDLVIAADGLHSPTRKALGLPGIETAVGEAYLRGVGEHPSADATVREIWAPDGRRFGVCPLPGGRTYFFCSVPLGSWQDILANRLTAWVESWADFGPDVVAVLKAVPDWSRVNYSELHEVRLERWYRPPLFVVGDAAHAMTPNLGQGANSAMVDGLVLMRLLAGALRDGGDLEAVGQTYDRLRRPFVTRIQTRARQVGALAAATSAPGRWLRDWLLAVTGHLGWLNRREMLLLAGYNPAEEAFFARLQ
jgi:2-polyprenyl-6-methoxyphenol hydroxylase-like FAD-dependent oxidoreductase